MKRSMKFYYGFLFSCLIMSLLFQTTGSSAAFAAIALPVTRRRALIKSGRISLKGSWKL
jgi:hypothetical protein